MQHRLNKMQHNPWKCNADPKNVTQTRTMQHRPWKCNTDQKHATETLKMQHRLKKCNTTLRNATPTRKMQHRPENCNRLSSAQALISAGWHQRRLSSAQAQINAGSDQHRLRSVMLFVVWGMFFSHRGTSGVLWYVLLLRCGSVCILVVAGRQIIRGACNNILVVSLYASVVLGWGSKRYVVK